jgi:N-acyl-D-amino-acid deacylase
MPKFLVHPDGMVGTESMTSYPAQRLGLLDGGILRDGMRADITVFDFDQIRPVYTYDNPRQQCRGIEYVILNGTTVMDRGRHTGGHPGRAMRGSAH